MNYFSLDVGTLSQPQFLGAPEAILGTWLKLVRFCAQAVNGGKILGAGAWDERLWLITCGCPLASVKVESALWKWDGNDLSVSDYPAWSENQFKLSSEGGSKGNLLRWGPKKQAPNGPPNRGATHPPSQAPNRLVSKVSKVKYSSNAHARENKNSASPPDSDLKTQWAATKSEIKRLEELESEQDGALPADETQELARLRKQLKEITRLQATGRPAQKPTPTKPSLKRA